MPNRIKAIGLFSEIFRAALFKKYAVVPSSSFVATQFNLRAYGASVVSRETARKWTKGITFPSPGHLMVLIKWLKLNPSDFLVELMENNRTTLPVLQTEMGTQEDGKICAQQILDSLSLQIAVVNQAGDIVQVNKSWRKFATDNSKIPGDEFFLGYNYLAVCENAVGSGAQTARNMALGVRKILHQHLTEFAIKYLCHAPHKKRWFVARVAPLSSGNLNYAVISHEAVSEANYSKLEFD